MQNKKPFHFFVFYLNIFITLISMLLIWATRSINFYFPGFQNFYNMTNYAGKEIREILTIVITLCVGFVIIWLKNQVNSIQSIKWGIITSIVGLLITLPVFYAFACCESLVTFYYGFPLGWLDSMTKVNSLPMPALKYLLQNFRNMAQWEIDFYALLVNIFFGIALESVFMHLWQKNYCPIGQERSNFLKLLPEFIYSITALKFELNVSLFFMNANFNFL